MGWFFFWTWCVELHVAEKMARFLNPEQCHVNKVLSTRSALFVLLVELDEKHVLDIDSWVGKISGMIDQRG